MIKECLTSALNCAMNTPSANGNVREGMNGDNYYYNGMNALASFIVLIVYIIIILFIGKFLWNEVLTKLVTIVKPADNIWQILGIAILVNLLYFS